MTTTHTIRFSSDGRFERNDSVAVSHREELPGGTIGLTTGHHDSSDAGTYEIAGNTIQLNYANGVRASLTFFPEPSEHGQQPPGMIWLDGKPILLK